MKTKYLFILITAGAILLLPQAADGAKTTQNKTTGMPASTQNLTKADIQSIEYMREEEKLAHDVYTFYARQYNIPIFRNISRSETVHQNAMMWLVDTYGLKDLAKAEGVFTNRELQKMYTELTKGTTLIEALQAGALIEEQDIEDLQSHLQKTDNPDIQRIYSNLLRASENHLRAFVRNLSRRGIDYQPKVLNLSQFSDIVQP